MISHAPGRRGASTGAVGTAAIAGAALITAGLVTSASAAADADHPRAGHRAVVTAAAGATTPGVSPDAACPDPYPADELTDGALLSGLTVESGTDPEPFEATVIGILDDGIAPDVDMILVEAESPAIERAGGIWSGMSGSPVYADDGRLVGAIAYGLTQSPSNVAGITPAAHLHELLDRPDAATAEKEPAATGTVDLPAALQETLVTSGAATEDQAGAGMRALPLPLAVSGVGPERLPEIAERMEEHLPRTRVYPAGSTDADAEGSVEDIVAGGNLAAAASFGDVTSAAVGTATMVCGDRTVAFGHPYMQTGASSMSVHPAIALLVQQDNAFGPFKVANPHGAVGVLDQDRLAGVRARLGEQPQATPITSTVTSLDDDGSRDGSTQVTMDRALPDLALSHLLANLDRVFDAIGAGTAELHWVIQGTRASGEPFTVDVANTYASQHDIAYETTFDAYDQLWSIQENEFEDVEITGVDYTATVSSAFKRYSVTAVEVRGPDGGYREPSEQDPTRIQAGSTLDIRVTLAPYRNHGDTVTVDLSADVPEDAAGSFGWLDINGGSGGDGDEMGDDTDDESDGPDDEPDDEKAASSPVDAIGRATDTAADFEGLLDKLAGLTPNNSVSAILTVESESDTGFETSRSTAREEVDQVVTGSFSFPIEIVR
ncbi:SpoIVB peptidase S55 domain-containing protein [Phytoactinopolyspora halotolerans]|uniref:Peptidase S55 domain-containing protein n=1 Tax=Phytoactinopolyspora halotolerans TaxID=1981512 RepID=A0A6L9SBY1_9ACTN|nr:SpoIVB peptidase S55 domain-containing protein [Phytoactinopolyspora halotolerans]NEE02865.1 hypothetical protein [Phytoactinopolyspora halotolerans]